MKLTEFDYNLPKELIAQKPLKQRDVSRLMVLDRKQGSICEKKFRNIVEYFKKGDLLVLNNTRVVPVRFYARRKTGAKVEIFLLNPFAEKLCALVRPSKKVKDGETVYLENGIEAQVFGKTKLGRVVEFSVPLKEVFKAGHVPLPPYISRDDTPQDREYYQTVYALNDGATASPTAGLHFTEKLLKAIADKGVSIVFVTLHTSYGTFAPVTVEKIENHHMHSEEYEISENSAKIINETKTSGGRVFAVGTTSVRVLETVAVKKNKVKSFKGETDIFIYPGYDFKIVDGMITNFHLPKSTLLMLVSAFAGKEFMYKAYQQAIQSKFRFFSYGDAMFIN
ncbi:MAG: tRNA preQ1(34) S-adenosylmethionine ribosyltransferase-isomerase QueA [Candidatus Omnitrophota bacterium]|nr:tRNA preQ1(34) S-adenosylmethionine ribosyltransferase-isomerase QueA [Candidatus Omnitrophota bacterium]MBU1895139.1 tRNA preQ1(34) S-adenosylmethionine ribosyltransferase-isomerase QueA [Candidatus Omnitrophota bacterium]